MKHNNQVVSVLAIIQQDLGSNPRSPICLVIFFLQVIKCRSRFVAYNAPPYLQQPDGQRPDLVIQNDGPPWGPVNVRI